MDSQQNESQYERLVDTMAELRERSRRIIAEAQAAPRPKLVFVYGKTCGRSRRAEGFLAQVLQRRHNHDTFDLIRVCAETNPELVRRFQVSEVPTILVINARKIEARLANPRGGREIEEMLGRWLR